MILKYFLIYRFNLLIVLYLKYFKFIFTNLKFTHKLNKKFKKHL